MALSGRRSSGDWPGSRSASCGWRDGKESQKCHGLDALPGLLPSADVVVLTVPFTPETSGMADAAFLARMKDGALLVNAARGPVVVTEALVAEVASGRLRAAMDVTRPGTAATRPPAVVAARRLHHPACRRVHAGVAAPGR